MTQKILVAIAFSEFSQGVINYAASIAGPLGAEVLIVNIINERDIDAVEKITSFGYKVDSEQYLETIKEERRAKLSELTAGLTLDDDKVSFSFLVGDPSSELLKVVMDENIDMVIMGVKTKDIRHIFTGSVAERMFRRCPCPVVSYRDETTARRLQKRIAKSRE